MKKVNHWWLLMIAGSLLAALGGFSLVSPWLAYIKLVHYGGIVLLLNGILLIAVSYTSRSSGKEKKWILAESVVDMLCGVVLIFNPLLSFIAFPFFIGSWMAGKGILKMFASIALAKMIPGWFFTLLAGILSTVFGGLVIYDPMTRPDSTTIFIGAFGLIMGALYIFDSIRFRKIEDNVNMMF